MPSEHYWLSPAVHPIYARLVLAELRRQGYQDNPALSVLGQNWEQQLQGNQFLNLETLCHLLQAPSRAVPRDAPDPGRTRA